MLDTQLDQSLWALFVVDINKLDKQGSTAEPEEVRQLTRQEALLAATRMADQNAKLSVFAVRPAIYAPIPNSLTEMYGTAFLVLGALLIQQRGDMVHDDISRMYIHAVQSIYVGLYIVVLVLGAAGTEIARNPARDFGSRLAHFL